MNANLHFLRPGHGTPTKCAHCGQPLRIVGTHIDCWRSSSGEFFCSEFCAEDAEEAAFQARRKALSQSP
jgi:hypothetical protein